MSSTTDKSPTKSLLPTQVLVLGCAILGVAALLFYLLFSISIPGEGRPFWYGIGTLAFEQIAFVLAAWLCLRNGLSSQIVSGRSVWLGIGLGLLSYFIGNIFFSFWELYWGLDPAVSPGDLFYLICYVCLSVGMILAVKSRRLNLEWWQWATTAGIALAGIALAAWLSLPLDWGGADAPPEPETAAEVAPSAEAIPTQGEAQAEATPEAIEEESPRPVPGWVMAMEEGLEPYSGILGLVYVVLDVALLIVATLLLLAFWGGRFSQSWRMIAAAAFSLYIADMWFKYADKNIPNYESGDLLEVFWVFTGVFFAIGAVLEYDVSTRQPPRERVRDRRRKRTKS